MEVKYQKIIDSIDPKKRYVLACSYGPDSMALFDMLIKSHAFFVVAHVNYHKRKEASAEENALRVYCDQHHIRFYLKHARYQKRYGNFQSWAREKRYLFFNDVYQQVGADALLTAHQQDDHIETYFLQKKRNVQVFQYGILSTTNIMDMNVIRPLKDLKKSETTAYCQANNVPFAIDSSNLVPIYARNQIRLNTISKMSDAEREAVLQEIVQENILLKQEKARLDAKFMPYAVAKIADLKVLKESELYYVLYRIVTRYLPPRKFTHRFFTELQHIVKGQKPNIHLRLENKEFVVREYDLLYVADFDLLKKYSYTITTPQHLQTDYFDIRFQYEMPARNIHRDDWPLTIRSANIKDTYNIKNYDVKVNRLFIDWKMPSAVRAIWPVFVSRQGEIIYIPRYQQEFAGIEESDFKIIIPNMIRGK